MSRVIPGVLMAASCLALLVWGPVLLIQTVFVVVAVCGLLEFFRMTCPSLKGFTLCVTILVALIPVCCSFFGTVEYILAGVVASLLGTVLIVLKQYTVLDNGYTYLSTVFLGTFYVSVSLAHLSFLSSVEHGASWLVLLLALTAGSDTGAYYIGKTFGKKKLLPAVSPKKTIAGAIGGLGIGTGVAVLVTLLLPLPLHLGSLLPAAAVLIIIGMIGDLAESAIKRSFQVKDSGAILAGHGGLLDRIDSLLFAGPVLFYFVWWGLLG